MCGLAEAVFVETRHRCLRADGRWRRAADDDGPEAALLTPLARCCLSADDPSSATTHHFIEGRPFVHALQLECAVRLNDASTLPH
ncbi:hypothetical protein [Streptomyces monashensis]|uniref:Uncharacterized protein n=1 Tax=Streptomyces monashensis TaxID=1678012 RepID=A0A1S2QLU4_9ACTN|nr:hypothetical protein [Streptomyces monashensis]OIK06426.1 hypothetical protein BIV23_08600 [Streptomyces monashensis]